MSSWISIKDKLPDDDDFYLVYFFDGSLSEPRVGVKWWQKATGAFLPWDAIDEDTHWQALPEPPKGERLK